MYASCPQPLVVSPYANGLLAEGFHARGKRFLYSLKTCALLSCSCEISRTAGLFCRLLFATSHPAVSFFFPARRPLLSGWICYGGIVFSPQDVLKFGSFAFCPLSFWASQDVDDGCLGFEATVSELRLGRRKKIQISGTRVLIPPPVGTKSPSMRYASSSLFG